MIPQDKDKYAQELNSSIDSIMLKTPNTNSASITKFAVISCNWGRVDYSKYFEPNPISEGKANNLIKCKYCIVYAVSWHNFKFKNSKDAINEIAWSG